MLNTTALFIGLFSLLHIALTVMVGYHRAKSGIQFHDGGDTALLWKIRAHGNFTEQVPIALLAMAAAEVSGASYWVLLLGGLSLLSGRLLHVHALITKGWSNGRGFGMIITLFSIGWLGGAALLLAFV
jgi:uncharacterized membrane protein YecN with MAPEG domain